MIDLFTGVIAKYFLGAALAVLVGVFTKITANYFGAENIDFGGIGVYNNFLHLDVRVIKER